jgi:hypothetical protein
MDRHQLPSYRRIPQPLFKFLPEEFAVGLVKRGSVRIGTAHDFRRTELHNAARGDPSEATPNSVALIDDVEIKPDEPMSDYLARHFAPNAWPTRMQDCIIEEIGEPNQDCFIYCLTGKHRWHFYDAFAATACVRIVDVPGFVECLAQHLASRTDGWDFARVTYGYRFGPLNDAHDRAPS